MTRRPAKACQGADSADFGYGDPEVNPCGAPATHRSVSYTYDGRGLVRDVTLACKRHATNEASGLFGTAIRFYRFRTLAGGR